MSEAFPVPEGHIVVGYVAHLKVLNEKGELYFAARSKDVNDMEALGLAVDMANSWQRDLNDGKRMVDE